jgi:hypothetical protein
MLLHILDSALSLPCTHISEDSNHFPPALVSRVFIRFVHALDGMRRLTRPGH